MRKLMYFLLLQITIVSYSQFYIGSGSVNVNQGAFILNNSSVDNYGEFKVDSTASLNCTGNSLIELSGDGKYVINNFNIDNDVFLYSDIQIENKIEFAQGVLNMVDNNIYLNGDLVNETENSYLTSTGIGEVVIENPKMNSGINNPGNVGLGISLISVPEELILYRGHQPIEKNGDYSISRYYRFNTELEINQLSFHYLDQELGSLFESDIEPWGFDGDKWSIINSESSDLSANIFEQTVTSSYSSFTLFESSSKANELTIPSGFTPNNDGVNETFIIEGIENYPNNKLVILNQWGDVVYEKDVYDNSWSGTSQHGLITTNENKLIDGTYFYLFYKNKNKDKPIKGFIEIKTDE